MMAFFRFLLTSLFLAGLMLSPARAEDAASLINALGAGSLQEAEAKIKAIAATGDPGVVPFLEALSEGDVFVRKSDHAVFITKKAGGDLALLDPLTGKESGTASKGELSKIKVNNNLRRLIRSLLGGLTLVNPDPAQRMASARTLLASPDPTAIDALDQAIAAEQDKAVKAAFELARAAAILVSDRPVDDKRAALGAIRTLGSSEALKLLATIEPKAGAEIAPDIAAVRVGLEQTRALWDAGQNVWYGVSLGSVLLLAAIGLAITFGVMGIINMAHGEMVMLGAYTTFVVQEIIRQQAPGLFDASLFIAMPLAFLVTALVGLLIERTIIRHLYGRPLETLLCTWGLSLILQQAVRSVFGPTNQEVGNPSFMSGSVDVGGLAITWNRLFIVIFSLAVFFVLLFLIKRTALGLKMRAVTANRRMAGSMGIRTPWVDAMTFGLGSGIAGLAGVALSQIENVSPNLGQGYIIDSFMVVVFGGVGNLWGTLVGAFSLGILNKFLEPYAGAVLGKILVLVLIILFIQKRPRGLFALKGRAVDA